MFAAGRVLLGCHETVRTDCFKAFLNSLDDAQRVVLVCDDRQLRAGRHVVELPHREFAFYRLLAVAAKDGWRGAGPDGLGDDHRGWVSYDQLLQVEGRVLARFLEFYDEAFLIGTRALKSSGRR